MMLVVALPAEAKPITAHFGLRRQQPDGAFPVYRNGRISLILSGVGKTHCAAATAFLYALNRCPQKAICLNVGIAGHADQDIGSALLAHTVSDVGSGQSWRRPFAFDPPCASDLLETVDAPDASYTRAGAVDMEASGFCAAALRFAPAEHVHCLKIISDNRRQDARGLRAADVRGLVSAHLGLLEQLLGRLDALAEAAPG